MGITLKLLVNKESKKVVYAEAGKKVVSRSSSSSSNSNYSYSSSQQTDEVDGYVKGAVAYMVMDDLTMTPSTISSINVFKTHGVKDMGTLQEMIIQVDAEKALNLVRAAFGSSTVLTDIFIGKAPSVKPTKRSKT